MDRSPRCCIPTFVEISLPVLEKIFEGFLPYMGMAAILVVWPMPLAKEAPHKTWLWSAKQFWRRRCFSIVDNGWRTDNDDRRWTMGILGELKILKKMWWHLSTYCKSIWIFFFIRWKAANSVVHGRTHPSSHACHRYLQVLEKFRSKTFEN